MEAVSLFQHFTTLTEKDYPLLRRLRVSWKALQGCLLRPRQVGGRQTSLDQHPRKCGNQVGPEVVAAEWDDGPAAAIPLRRGGKKCQLPTLLIFEFVLNEIRSFISATRFGEQVLHAVNGLWVFSANGSPWFVKKND